VGCDRLDLYIYEGRGPGLVPTNCRQRFPDLFLLGFLIVTLEEWLFPLFSAGNRYRYRYELRYTHTLISVHLAAAASKLVKCQTVLRASVSIPTRLGSSFSVSLHIEPINCKWNTSNQATDEPCVHCGKNMRARIKKMIWFINIFRKSLKISVFSRQFLIHLKEIPMLNFKNCNMARHLKNYQ